MSDMNTPEVPESTPEAAPADVVTQVPSVEEAPAPEAEETKDEPEAEETKPEPVPVLAQQPSSAAQEPETAPERERLAVEDAARIVITLVRAHRTIGDVDLGAAIEDLEAAFPAPVEEEKSDAEQA